MNAQLPNSKFLMHTAYFKTGAKTHLLLATLIAGALYGGIAPRRRWAGICVAIFLVIVAGSRALESARAGRTRW
jgi:hypothetical protein